jgi:thiol-disulfide isomerase/thioredoxin
MLKTSPLLKILALSLFSQIILAQNKRNIEINLKQEINNNIAYDDDLVEFQFKSIKNMPLYSKTIIDTYKGFPKFDSLSIYINAIDLDQYYFDMYRECHIEKEKYLKFIQNNEIDTLKLSKKPLKQTLVTLIGYENNKQFIIADTNNNKDFGDENKYEFDIDFINSSESNQTEINKLPLSDYVYEDFDNGKINLYKRKIIPYPNQNHIFSQRLSSKEKKYLAFLQFRDYWNGKKSIKKKQYDFYVQATSNKYAVVYIKSSIIKFSTTDKSYNRQFLYQLKDTVNLNGDLYKLDSLDRQISKLYLTEIKNKGNKFGHSIGTKIENFKLNDLNNKSFTLSDKYMNKDYTLLEFWGTWCKPCVEMMPKIKKLALENSTQLELISIAVDKDIDKVNEFTLKKEMFWSNAFLDINKKNEIINQLKIQLYPTFILLNKSQEIIWRGSISSFDEIEKIISK